jgi:hypothetical protein
MKTGGEIPMVADVTSMICMSRVDENVAVFESEVFLRSLGPMHCQKLFAEGTARIHAWRVMKKIKIPHGMIQSLEDHCIWCCQITREIHDGICKVDSCGDIHVEECAIPMEQGTNILFLE